MRVLEVTTAFSLIEGKAFHSETVCQTDLVGYDKGVGQISFSLQRVSRRIFMRGMNGLPFPDLRLIPSPENRL